MQYSRRDFVRLSSAAAAASASQLAWTKSVPTDGDPLGVRNDFPITRTMAYFNAPYVAPSPTMVVDATKAFIQTKADDPIGLGSMLEEVAETRQKFASLVGADVGEIGLLSATSEGENIVTASIDWRSGDNVVIDNLHYSTSVFLYQHLAETKGVELRIVENVDGESRLVDFEQQIDARTRMVSVSWVSHQNGFRHNLSALAELAHAHNAYLYADAIQGIGSVPLDVRKTDVDFFTAGGYKWLLSGYGVAPFFVRAEHMESIKADRIGWRQLESMTAPDSYRFYDDARKFGYATPAFGAIYQMSAALSYLSDIGVDAIAKHSLALAGRLNQDLRERGFEVLTPLDNQSPIVAFVHGIEPGRAKQDVTDANIRLSFREESTQIRTGVALFNNDDDIDRLMAVVNGWR